MVITSKASASRTHTEECDFFWNPLFPIEELKENHEILSGTIYSPAKTLTLKGRVEWFPADYKAVTKCISQTKGIIRLNYWQNIFEITWLLEETHYEAGVIDHRDDAEKFIDEFISLLLKEQDLHVFIQSLKPINQYDGVRNGPWSRS